MAVAPVSTGRFFDTVLSVLRGLAALSATDGLTVVYNEVMAKLQDLSNMLDSVKPFPSLPAQLAASLTPTALTLTVTPATAYVGDKVNFTGALSSQGKPLSERTITMLLNNADLLTVQTDANGQFQGTFQLPYLYISPMPMQAIYYPQGNDAGVYLAATSPITNLTVLFYTAKLTLQQNNTAYPGKESTVTGTFDYGNAPGLNPAASSILPRQCPC